MSFIRKIKKAGSIYLAKVESYRENGKVKQRVLEYIGKEEGGKPVVKVDLNKINVSSVKRYMDIEILHKLSLELGLPKLLGDYHKPLLALIYAQLLQKNSVRQIPEWIEHTTICDSLQCEGFSTKELYESLTNLENIEFGKIESHLIAFWKKLAPEDSNTVVLDVTDTYFSGSTAGCKPRRGKDGIISKLLQIGLIVSFKNGFPLLHKTYEGNIPNVKIFEDMLKEISDNGLRGIILDRGFFSKKNIEDIKQLGMEIIVGVKQTVVLQKLFLKTIDRDEIYSKKHQVVLKETIVYVKPFNYLGGKIIAIYNPTLEVLKRDKILAGEENEKDFKYVGYSFIYHNTQYTEAEVVKKYFEKDVVERTFKKIKGPISLRPIRVWVRQHVIAHVKVCYLAMAILSLLEFKCKKIKISGIDALKTIQYIYKVKLHHADTKKEWDKVVVLNKVQKELLKVLKCSV
ncbi:MAG: transposase [Bacteroidia bacterium]|nr:transposase [Bacteroidia bacterium]